VTLGIVDYRHDRLHCAPDNLVAELAPPAHFATTRTPSEPVFEDVGRVMIRSKLKIRLPYKYHPYTEEPQLSIPNLRYLE